MSEPTRETESVKARALPRQGQSWPARYERAESGLGPAQPWAGPLAFDDSGYPVAQEVPRFAERVRRLLSGR